MSASTYSPPLSSGLIGQEGGKRMPNLGSLLLVISTRVLHELHIFLPPPSPPSFQVRPAMHLKSECVAVLSRPQVFILFLPWDLVPFPLCQVSPLSHGVDPGFGRCMLDMQSLWSPTFPSHSLTILFSLHHFLHFSSFLFPSMMVVFGLKGSR